jgi:hypothetical protein
MKKVIAIIVVVLLGVLAFLYYVPYSEGDRVGTIIKVSKRGTIFKTYEGQLNVNTFGAIKGKSGLTESFEFSIPDDPELIAKIDGLLGQPIKLSYEEKYYLFPWLGETKYLVTDVTLTTPSAENTNDYPRN